MSATTNAAMQRLHDCGLKPSVQRLAILEYLQSHHNHPTIEDIYKSLEPSIPTLSKTTVYSTLRLLAEHGAAQMLTMDEHRVCYDGDTSPHVHFVCKQCGRIYDIMDKQAPSVERNTDIGVGRADEVQLFYKGTCADCLEKEQSNKK